MRNCVSYLEHVSKNLIVYANRQTLEVCRETFLERRLQDDVFERFDSLRVLGVF